MRQVLYYTTTGELKLDASPAELSAAVANHEATIWIDLQSADDADWEFVLSLYKFHPLAVEDCRGRVQRPKVEEYPGHLLLVFHGLSSGPQAKPADTIELDALLTPNLLVTVHEEPLRSVSEVLDKCQKSSDYLARGADRILHGIVDRMVDYYFPVVEEFEERLDRIEERIFEHFDRSVYEEIFDAKKHLLSLRRFMGPQRETMDILVFRSLPGIRPETQIFFRDVHDHMIRLHDNIETFRDMLSGALDSYLSQVSNRMNEVMKVLTIVGTIVLPLSFLTGVFGMNFDVIPGLHNEHGFWILAGAMALIAGGLLVVFKARRWL